jgi:maltose O-acetyltransferase
VLAAALARIELASTALILRQAEAFPGRWRRWLAMYHPDARVRTACWRSTGVSIGADSYGAVGMTVADDYSSGDCLLSIGDRVSIGPGVSFAPNSLPNNSPAMLADPEVAKLARREPIHVDDDAWIGANVTVLAGVRIGRGAVVGGGAVVTRVVADRTIVAGVPARPLRTLAS